MCLPETIHFAIEHLQITIGDREPLGSKGPQLQYDSNGQKDRSPSRLLLGRTVATPSCKQRTRARNIAHRLTLMRHSSPVKHGCISCILAPTGSPQPNRMDSPIYLEDYLFSKSTTAPVGAMPRFVTSLLMFNECLETTCNRG